MVIAGNVLLLGFLIGSIEIPYGYCVLPNEGSSIQFLLTHPHATPYPTTLFLNKDMGLHFMENNFYYMDFQALELG